MYIMTPRRPPRVRRWSVATARARLPEVFAAAAREPQAVYRHDEPVGVIVSPREFVALDADRRERESRTLADAFAALRRLGADRLLVPKRRDRRNPFARDRH
jgi:hypothetical protein